LDVGSEQIEQAGDFGDDFFVGHEILLRNPASCWD
jgi:hypothetical protein